MVAGGAGSGGREPGRLRSPHAADIPACAAAVPARDAGSTGPIGTISASAPFGVAVNLADGGFSACRMPTRSGVAAAGLAGYSLRCIIVESLVMVYITFRESEDLVLLIVNLCFRDRTVTVF